MSHWTCEACSLTVIPKYNPFADWEGTETDKHYDNDCGADILTVSRILSDCKTYTTASLNFAINDIINITK